MKTSLVDYDVSQEMRFAGPSVFIASRPSIAVGEVYDTEGGLDRWWFAWIRPDGATYMSARGHSRKAVLEKLEQRSGLKLRTRKGNQ